MTMKEEVFGRDIVGVAWEAEVVEVVWMTVHGRLTVRGIGTKEMIVETLRAVSRGGNRWVDCPYDDHTHGFVAAAVEEAVLSFVEIDIVQQKSYVGIVADENGVVDVDCFGIGCYFFRAASFCAQPLFSCFSPRVLFRRHYSKLRWSRRSLRHIY